MILLGFWIVDIRPRTMDRGSARSQLMLIIITGILAGIVSAITGWKLAFVWYIITIICVVIAAVA
jgi:predicted PurR-regulated permease PerM